MISVITKAKSCRAFAACLLFSAVLLLSQGSARADTITFEFDPLGLYPSGLQSVQSSLVRFSATGIGAVAVSENFGSEFLGTRGLAVSGSPDVHLVMDFAVPVNSVGLWFGNDEPTATSPPLNTAILQVFFNDVLVGQTTLEMNRNDIMDQRISFSGTQFNRAIFFFSQELFLTETVDNVDFSVPEPTSLALLGIGIAGMVTRLRRRVR